MTIVTRARSRSAVTPPLRNITTAIEQQLGAIEQWPLDRLCVYERHARVHSERQMTALVASMREFGLPMPLLVSETGELICGHARLEAARRLGLATVPVLVARCWSEARIKAYRLADNRIASLGTWDEKLLALEIASIVDLGEVSIELMGWSTGEIDKILDIAAAPETADPDAVPEPPVTPVSQPGDLWRLGTHRLLNASSLDAASWMLLMDGRKADLCLSDGPFNCPVNGHVSGSGRFAEFAMASGEMSPTEFTQFNASWLGAVQAHLRDGALVMAFMDHAHCGLFELMTAARQVGLRHLNMCVWAKTNAGMGSLWRSQHELICGAAIRMRTRRQTG